MRGEDSGLEVFRRAEHMLVAIFYLDEGIPASPCLARVQEVLDLLTGLFDQAGLRTNFNNMVGINCQPCCTAG